jgi:adenylate cyclase
MANKKTRAGAGWNVGVISLMIAAMLIGLPLAVWLDLRNLVASNLLRQANDVNSVISSMRSFYSTNVVGRILAVPGVATRVSAHFETIPGAIPIPSTLSLELGRVIGMQQKNMLYLQIVLRDGRMGFPH